MTVELWSPSATSTIDVVLIAPAIYSSQMTPSNEILLHRAEFNLNADKHVTITMRKEGIRGKEDGKQLRLLIAEVPSGSDIKEIKSIHLTSSLSTYRVPDLQKSLTPLLTTDEIKRKPEDAKILFDVADSSLDDSSVNFGNYSWSNGLKRGSLDITRFTVSSDTSRVWFDITFRDLCYPTGHPEFGFDRTITAIALNNNEVRTAQQTTIGRNAEFSFTNFSFSEIIFIGKGLRIEDGKGKVLAEYFSVPADENHPLGNFNTNSISFSVPTSIIGRPGADWRYALVTGVRDDSEGGVGRFQTLERRKGSHQGTRKDIPKGNVYDLLIPPSGK